MEKIKGVLKRNFCLLLAVLFVFTMIPATALLANAATTVTLVGLSDANIGTVYTTDDADKAFWSAGSDSIDGSALSTSGTCGATANTTTLTIQNNKNDTATLSFDYSVTLNNGTVQVGGATVTSGTSFSKELGAGESIKIYIKSADSSAATAISLSNIKLVSDVTATVTFEPAENGSYTVDGKVISSQMSNTQSSTIAYSLVATPNTGYKFLGWYSVTDGKFLSTASTTAMNIDSDKTITAKFAASSAAIFDAGGQLFADLNEAVAYAVSNSLTKIVLAESGIISAGDYNIPAGVTLLIPFDSGYTTYTTSPVGNNSYKTPTKFRELTMASGANLTVYGELNLSAMHYAANGGASGGGAPSGPCSFIKMNSGSTITLGSGATAYVWGFIYGDGKLTAKSGSAVYENMQINDFRGGSATSNLVKTDIFPFSQYRVQNVEVEEILEYGSDVYAYTSLYVSIVGVQSTCVHFIGATDAMFKPHEGTVITKQYLPNEDHLMVSVSGDMDISSLKLSVAGTNVDSANYILPINSCFIVNVLSGTTFVSQDISLHPGVKMNISENATLSIASGNKMILFDADDFVGKKYVYPADNGDGNRNILKWSPTKRVNNSATQDAMIDVNGTIVANGGFYTTTGGAEITSSNCTGIISIPNGVGTETTTNQYANNSTQVTVDITPAKLTNGSVDAPFTLTSVGLAGDYYRYASSKDKWENTNIKTVSWINDDGSVLATDEVRVGELPVYSGSTPVKTLGEAGYKYEFSHWTPAVQSVTEDIIYKAGYALRDGIYWLEYPDGYGPDPWDLSNNEEYASSDYSTKSYFALDKDGQLKTELDGLVVCDANSKLSGNGVSVDLYGMTLWFENGMLSYHPGLVYDSMSDAYYYFPSEYYFGSGMVADCDYYVTKTNDMVTPDEFVGVSNFMPGKYSFDISGKMLLHDGIVQLDDDLYYFEYGAKVYAGLIMIDGDYYYINSSAKVVCGRDYYVSKTNGLLPADTYSFASDGKMIVDVSDDTTLNGIVVDSNGVWHYYMNGIKVYAGLIEIDGDYYYVNSSCEVIHGRSYAVSKSNGLMKNGTYEFDADGKMILRDTTLNGIVTDHVTGETYYYVDGIKNYAGLIEIDGDYYYVNSSCKVISDCEYYVSKTNNLLPAGKYSFGADGKLVIEKNDDVVLDGIVKESDSVWYYYVKGVKVYAGLIELDGDYYYVNSSCQVIHGRSYAVSKNNGLMQNETYEFDADGKMILKDTALNGIVKESDSVWFYYVDGVKTYAGLIEIDGKYYYVNSSFNVIHGRTYYVSKDNGIGMKGSFAFDNDGAMITE